VRKHHTQAVIDETPGVWDYDSDARTISRSIGILDNEWTLRRVRPLRPVVGGAEPPAIRCTGNTADVHVIKISVSLERQF